MKKHIISLTGDLAAGKTRVTDLLQAELNYSVYRNGERFRTMALEMGMNVTEFGFYVKEHPEIDRQLEAKATEYAKTNDCFIIDAKMGWYAIPESFKVYLKVEKEEGARRAFEDMDVLRKKSENFSSVEEYKKDMERRYQSENERYFNLYGVRREDMSNYDLIIDTTHLSIQEVKEKIIEEYKKWLADEEV